MNFYTTSSLVDTRLVNKNNWFEHNSDVIQEFRLKCII